jgi:hypothetical protein
MLNGLRVCRHLLLNDCKSYSTIPTADASRRPQCLRLANFLSRRE